MNGTLAAEDTPGGGLTMVLTLRAVPSGPAPARGTVDPADTDHPLDTGHDQDRTTRQKAGPQ